MTTRGAAVARGRAFFLCVAACLLGGSVGPVAPRAAAAISFLPPVQYTGTGASGITADDFDGDGYLDLAVGSIGDDRLSLLYGRGDGTFEAPVDLRLGGRYHLALGTDHQIIGADVNGDGMRDLVVPHGGLDKVVVFINRGQRTYAPGANYPVGGGPTAVTADDFNGDGWIDLAVSNHSSNNLSVLLNRGNGTFRPAVSYSAGGHPGGISSADLNEDGNIDLVLAAIVGSTVFVYLGDGTGKFAAASTHGVGGSPGHVILEDFDADGKLDIATPNWFGNSISILFGDGSGKFRQAIHYAANGYAGVMGSGDLDGDGDPDLVWANGGASQVSVLENQEAGNFAPAIAIPSGGEDTRTIAVGDFNGDGLPDVAAGGQNTFTVSILINDTPLPTPAIRALSVDPDSVIGGCESATGVITLSAPAPAGGVEVALASTNPAVSVPASVRIPEGEVSFRFTPTLSPGTMIQTGTITASFQGSGRRARVTVRPGGTAGLRLSHASVIGGQPVTGEVSLACPAGPGGVTVALGSSHPTTAVVPATLVVPAGALNASFPVTTREVTVSSAVVITARFEGLTRTAPLEVRPTPPPPPSMSASSQAIVYRSDFETGAQTGFGPGISGGWSSGPTRRSPSGRYGQFLGEFGSQTVRLTLHNLPHHTEVSLSFLLFLLRSWDGSDSTWGPDIWSLEVEGGPRLVRTTFSNVLNFGPDHSTFPQAFPGSYPDSIFGPYTGALEVNTLGYLFGGFPMDSVYPLRFTFPHTGSSLTLLFTGANLQDAWDESWGLDDLQIQVTGPGLAAPTGLTARAVSDGQINLAWIDNSHDETGFAVHRRENAGHWTQIVLLGPNVTRFADLDVRPGAVYAYRVQAVRDGESSAFSNEATAAVPPFPDRLGSQLLVSSHDTHSVLRYDAATGALIDPFVPTGSGGLGMPHGLAVGPDGNLYVCNRQYHSILRYDIRTGTFLGEFVPARSGGLDTPIGLVFGPDGQLYVSSYGTHSILRYEGRTGAFLGAFVAAGQGGLRTPYGLQFGPDGHLYVCSQSGSNVLRYDGRSGTFLGAFVPPGSGGLDGANVLAFGPDGHLYVSSWKSHSILRYDGRTGAFLGVFVPTRSGGLTEPWGLAFGPDGHLYVCSAGTDSVLRYDGRNGSFLDPFIAGSGLQRPDWLLFMPADPPAPPLPLTAPTGLNARAVTPTRVDLSWAAPVPSATGIGIWRKRSDGDWERVGVAAPSVTRFSDRSVSPNTTYTYRVRAHNDHVASAWSNEATVTTPAR